MPRPRGIEGPFGSCRCPRRKSPRALTAWRDDAVESARVSGFPDPLGINRELGRATFHRSVEVLGQTLREATVRANLVRDAHLAALAIEHGLVLTSTDGDFARFPGLRFENPLAGPIEV
jgi:predicted nucleic acid-binding protein